MAVALPDAIAGVQKNLRTFSKSLVNAYRQNTSNYTSKWAGGFLDLREQITKEASQYARDVIPKYDDLMESIDDFFEHYMNFSFDAWVDRLSYIETDAKRCADTCNDLVERHQPILDAMKTRRNVAGKLLNEALDAKNDEEDEIQQLNTLAEKKKNDADFFWYIPLIGLPFYHARKHESEKAAGDAASRRRQLKFDQKAINNIEEISAGLDGLIDWLENIAGCIAIVRKFAKKGTKKIRDSQSDKEAAKLHYDEMLEVAPEVRRLCTVFQGYIPAIRSDFHSIC